MKQFDQINPLGTAAVILLSLFAGGCAVESTEESTGGVDDDVNTDSDTEEEETPVPECPAGVAIVLSDYVSSQIALSDLEGTIQSASFVSTASAQTDGLAFAFSGDIALPSSPTLSGDVVLLDRYGTNVISWIETSTAEVVAQLAVGTGFESNPQDYLEISETLALVTRWGQNAAPGAEDFDDGGDVLVIDLETREIVSSVVVAPEDDLPARPSSLSLVHGEVFVTLDRIALDFSATGEAQILTLDAATSDVLWKYTIEGRKACGRATLSPSEDVIAIACTGVMDATGVIEDISESALILFDANKRPLEVIATFEAEDLLGEGVQGGVAFADETHVLLKTQTTWGGVGNNRLFALDLDTGDTEVLLEANADDEGKGKGVVFGSVACSSACSNICLMTDADSGVLQRIQFTSDATFEVLDAVTVEDVVGLPPVGISHR